MSHAVTCPYCGEPAALVFGEALYPHRPDLYAKQFYRCDPCDATVGCHPGTTKPLGRMANAELRWAKMEAHTAFDRLWKAGSMTRSAAYAWLAGALGIEKSDCHIGMFDVEQCLRVALVCAHQRQASDAPANTSPS